MPVPGRNKAAGEAELMNKLLTNESPLQLLPSLAAAIGINESIVLQQIHYWLITKPKMHEGKPWVYNSAPEWQQQFPFWSVPTIRRILGNLRDAGILEVGNFNPEPQDRTFWYTINYDQIPCQTSALPCDQPDQVPSDQSDQIPCDQPDQIPVDHVINLGTSCDQPDQMQVINMITSYSRTETNTETNNRNNSEGGKDLDGSIAATLSPATEPILPPNDARPGFESDWKPTQLPTPPKARASPMGKTSSAKVHRPLRRRDDPLWYDDRKLVNRNIPAGTGTTPCEVLFEFVPCDPERISRSTLERVHFEATDLEKWRRILAEIDGRGWRLYNITDRLKVYREGFQYQHSGNGATEKSANPNVAFSLAGLL